MAAGEVNFSAPGRLRLKMILFLTDEKPFMSSPIALDLRMINVLRMVAAGATPPWDIAPQRQSLIELRLIADSGGMLSVTAEGAAVLSDSLTGPISSNQAYCMGYEEGAWARQLGTSPDDSTGSTRCPIAPPAAFREEHEIGFKAGIRGEPNMPATS
jgi:hypothetical protein